MTSSPQEILWTAYLDAYGPIAADERLRLLEQSVADDVAFTNPRGEGKTREGLLKHIERYQEMMPGNYFQTDRVYSHHEEILAIWSMFRSDNSKIATGYNFVRLNKDGRFGYMAGFF